MGHGVLQCVCRNLRLHITAPCTMPFAPCHKALHGAQYERKSIIIGGIMNKRLTLGEALQRLTLERSGDAPPEQEPLSAESDAYLAQLREQLERLSTEKRSRAVLGGIPHHCCRLNHPHLLNHEAFFLSLYLLEKAPEDCERLAIHLNNCFPCAEVFAEVLRDFRKPQPKNS